MTVSGNACAVLGAERVALELHRLLCPVLRRRRPSSFGCIAYQRAGLLHPQDHAWPARALQKYAARCGGGFNHRFGLDDAILIKDNHVAVAGGVRAVLSARAQLPDHLVKIEIEVDTLRSARQKCWMSALPMWRCSTTWTRRRMKKAVEMTAGRLVLEASGGITHTKQRRRRRCDRGRLSCRQARSRTPRRTSTSDLDIDI